MAGIGGSPGGSARIAALAVAVLSLFVLVAALAAPAFALEKTSVAAYKSDTARLAVFIRVYLEGKWGLSGENTNNLVKWVVKYSLENDTDPLLQLSRILKESSGSHFRLNSRGERQVKLGGGGTIGFSQIHPFWIGKTVGGVKFTKEMLLDPEGNVRAGIILYKRYDNGNYLDALTHYQNPSAKSPSAYAKNIERVYLFMLSEYRRYKSESALGDMLVGSAIVLG